MSLKNGVRTKIGGVPRKLPDSHVVSPHNSSVCRAVQRRDDERAVRERGAVEHAAAWAGVLRVRGKLEGEEQLVEDGGSALEAGEGHALLVPLERRESKPEPVSTPNQSRNEWLRMLNNEGFSD